MNNFHGTSKHRSYFEGWYLKQQSGKESLALIPAFHVDECGNRTASLQVITNSEAFHIDFAEHSFHATKDRFCVHLGNCLFSDRGCRLDIKNDTLELRGFLHYGPFTMPSGDIMGPFRFAPLLQCRHSIFSLNHRVDGKVVLNGKEMVFENGRGYMEGDRGSSFPSRYVWSQCSWDNNCLVLSAADIPFMGRCFTGCVGSLLFEGRDFRFGTYCGAKLLYVSEKAVILRQGKVILQAELLEGSPLALRAPQSGGMTRTVFESVSCRVRYKLMSQGKVLFDFVSENASFESDWMKPVEPKPDMNLEGPQKNEFMNEESLEDWENMD